MAARGSAPTVLIVGDRHGRLHAPGARLRRDDPRRGLDLRLKRRSAGLVATLGVGAPAGARTQGLHLTSRPFTVDGFATRLPKVHVRAPGRAGYVTRMNAVLVDARTRRRVSIRDVTLHHVVFINDGHRGRVAPGSCEGRYGQPFYDTGEERERLFLPGGMGYRVRPHDRWRMQTML